MKNFIMLTDADGREFGVAVSLIKYWVKDGAITRVYLEDFNPRATNYRYVKENTEEIAAKIEGAQKESHEFVTFVHTSLGKAVCVKVSEICWMRECSSAKWTKVCVNGLGEFEVCENIHIISEKLNLTKFYGEC